ncbi:hypothetical protein [Rathayibacter sp. AY1H3]|uniref:hypothetical protein n=1 Tax=Rathayibacter sp. AY1H3 TaxID=2080567 RepID=UPI0015E49477|nr:hypothetical protein [Rathayibacter sp. AY1H3]
MRRDEDQARREQEREDGGHCADRGDRPNATRPVRSDECDDRHQEGQSDDSWDERGRRVQEPVVAFAGGSAAPIDRQVVDQDEEGQDDTEDEQEDEQQDRGNAVRAGGEAAAGRRRLGV